MLYMLCRNKVSDFDEWKRTFDSHMASHREAGLVLTQVWREIQDQNNVFFLFEVRDADKARAFVGAPEAAVAGKVSGVLEGEYHLLENAQRY